MARDKDEQLKGQTKNFLELYGSKLRPHLDEDPIITKAEANEMVEKFIANYPEVQKLQRQNRRQRPKPARHNRKTT